MAALYITSCGCNVTSASLHSNALVADNRDLRFDQMIEFCTAYEDIGIERNVCWVVVRYCLHLTMSGIVKYF